MDDPILSRLRVLAKDAPETISLAQRDQALELMERVRVRVMKESPPSLWGDISELTRRIVDKINLFTVPTMDEQVKKILDASPEHQDMLKRFEQDRVLRERAFSHFDALMHLRWSLYDDDIRPFFKEPRDGVLNESAWDAWVDNNQPDHLKLAKDALEKQRSLLNGVFEKYKNETWGPKQPSVVIQGKRHLLVGGRIEP